MALRIGDEAPNFQVDTTQGPIDFHQWIGNSYADTRWIGDSNHYANSRWVCYSDLNTSWVTVTYIHSST